MCLSEERDRRNSGSRKLVDSDSPSSTIVNGYYFVVTFVDGVVAAGTAVSAAMGLRPCDFDSAADSANDSKIFMIGLSAVFTMMRRYEADSF